MEIKLSFEEIKELRKLHKATKDRNKADRIKTILLLNDGYNYKKIAEILLLDEKTIINIENRYKEDGKERFLENNYVTYCGKLKEEEIKEVLKYVENNIIMDLILIVNYIKENYKKDYTRQGISELLNREGFVYKKTKKVPSKANKEKQEEFIREYKKLTDNLKEKEKIYFIDGVHPLHNV